MLYRVHAVLAFSIPDEATDFYHDCELALAKAITINPGQPNEEKGYIFLEKCYHDQNPTIPCNTLKENRTE